MTIDRPKVYYGARNASTAVFVDGTRFLVADDEDQQQTVLRLFDVNGDGRALDEFLLNDELLEPDPDEPEIDLEASAWHNGRIFWTGSHSRSRKGKRRQSRHRFFATTMQDCKPVISGTPYKTLLADAEAAIGKTLDCKGVCIEGLAAMPGDGLLIAFRSPLFKKKALVIELKNPEELIEEGGAPRFGDPVFLDLDGRGVRSLEYWPERSSYLLIAGPEGDGDEDFSLMRWSGPISNRPEPLCRLSFGLENCSPEGLLIGGSNTVHILFDEGDRKEGEASFRSIAIHDLLP